MSKNPKCDKMLKLLSDTSSLLGEHFDSVQIIATTRNPDEPSESVRFSSGSGSFYERFGALREQMLAWEQDMKEKA